MAAAKLNTVFDLVERIDTSQTPEELIAELAKAAEQFGFQATAISAYPHPNIPFEKRLLAYRWPGGWIDRYLSQNYIETDPIFRFSRTSLRPFEFSEASYEEKSREALMMSELAEFGYSSGFCVPTMSPYGPINVAFCGERSEMSREDQGTLHFVAIYAQLRITELLAGKLRSVAEVLRLSPRELEVLRWCAEGKTSDTIATILGISTHTVLTHIGGACRKLGTRSRTAAVAKAVHAGLITVAP